MTSNTNQPEAPGASKPAATIEVTYTYHGEDSFTFDPRDLWGKRVPANLSANKVVEKIRGIRKSKFQSLADWIHDETGHLNVDWIHIQVVGPNPHYQGDDVLFGDPPPATIVTEVSFP